MLKPETPEFFEYCDIIAEINKVEESISPRLIREALIDDADAVAKLQSINSDIEKLRAKAKKIYDKAPKTTETEMKKISKKQAEKEKELETERKAKEKKQKKNEADAKVLFKQLEEDWQRKLIKNRAKASKKKKPASSRKK
jgi:hypothetical protein